jgi:hypothetical protein
MQAQGSDHGQGDKGSVAGQRVLAWVITLLLGDLVKSKKTSRRFYGENRLVSALDGLSAHGWINRRHLLEKRLCIGNVIRTCNAFHVMAYLGIRGWLRIKLVVSA